MNSFINSGVYEGLSLLEINEVLRQLGNRDSAVATQMLGNSRLEPYNELELNSWSDLYGAVAVSPSTSPSVASQAFSENAILYPAVSPSASLSFNNWQADVKLTSKQIMQVSRKSFEDFKKGRQEYKSLRGRDLSLLLDDE